MAIRSLKTGQFSRSTQVGNSIILPGDYESIATVTVGSGGAASVEFSSIPSTFTHLQVRAFFKSSQAINTSGAGMRFNSATTNYVRHTLQGNGTSAEAGANTTNSFIAVDGGTDSANQWSTSIIDILDYANTNKNKTVRTLFGMDNNGSGAVALVSGLWISTNAITSITLYGNNIGGFTQYSHFALYGIRG